MKQGVQIGRVMDKFHGLMMAVCEDPEPESGSYPYHNCLAASLLLAPFLRLALPDVGDDNVHVAIGHVRNSDGKCPHAWVELVSPAHGLMIADPTACQFQCFGEMTYPWAVFTHRESMDYFVLHYRILPAAERYAREQIRRNLGDGFTTGDVVERGVHLGSQILRGDEWMQPFQRKALL